MTRALALLLLVAIHCAHSTHADAPKPAVAAEELVDHWGDSPQTAVSVPADAPEGGADFENNWIFEQYGRFKRNGGGTGTLEGRRYNVVKIELESGEKKAVYFDITELWARSQQQ
jgi:hypothetical protein